MLRITRTEDAPPAVTLRLEGRIPDQWVAVLEEESLRVLQEDRELVLDCAEVMFVDAAGRELLRRLAGGRARLIQVSPLLESLLGVSPAGR